MATARALRFGRKLRRPESAATGNRCPANTHSSALPPRPSINIDYASELNEQQLAAVTASPGPLLVIAGAGSGKTRTLTYRVAYLLENGIDPHNILLLTFTNKAARQMLDRVATLLPIDASGLWGGTFHSIGNRMLRRHGSALGYSSGFTIMDREDQKDLINTVVAAAGINAKEIRFPKGDVLAEIFSFVVNTETPIDELLAEKFPYFLPLLDQIKDVHARYEKKKKSTNSMDFDDLLEKTLRMLKEHEEIADFYRRQFQFILVDEYQDTNKIQADFIDTLASEHRNVMVVGDDAQSIYSWRGANFKNILAFPAAISGRAGFQDRTELPERAGHSSRGQRGHRRERAAVSEATQRHAADQCSQAGRGGVERRQRAGAIRRPADFGTAR